MKRIVLMVVLIAVVLGTSACDVLNPAAGSSDLAASGVISATEIRIAAEVSGRVTAIHVSEGDTVAAGDVLFSLDDEALQAQRAQAAGALQQAQAGLIIAQSHLEQARQGNARPADIAAARAQLAQAQAQYDALIAGPRQPQIDSARAAVTGAQAAYRAALAAAGTTDAQLAAAQAAKDQARVATEVAQDQYDEIAGRAGDSGSRRAMALQDATLAYQAAQANYDALFATSGPNAQAAVQQAAAQLSMARANLDLLERPYTDNDLKAAKAAVDLAQANLDRLTTAATDSDIAIAQASVDQAQGAVTAAQAALGLIDLQVKKCTVTAPVAGVITARDLEIGELVAAGGTVLAISELTEVNLTVYLPEDRYGQVALGQAVHIAVDSFPGRTFTGHVQYIASEAEFTPRNVQTVDGRRATVYAVKILVPNEQLELKPGMPADVTFDGR